MRTLNIVIGSAIAVVVAAQSASELAAAIPACAIPVVNEAATSVGCDTTDYACICGPKKQEITVLASPKIVEGCGDERFIVRDSIDALCAFVEAASDSAVGDGRSAAAKATTATTSELRPVITSPPSLALTPSLSMFLLPMPTRGVDGTLVSETSFKAADVTPTTTEQQPQDTSMSTSRPSGSESGGGLSTGVKAGIGAGIAVVAIIGLLFSFLLWRRHKRSKQPVPLHVIDNHGDSHDKVELVGTEIGVGKAGRRFSLFRKAELPENSSNTAGMAEMGGSGGTDHRLPELESKGGMQEHTSRFSRTVGNTPAPASVRNDEAVASSGPVPLASDLYGAPQSSDAVANDQAYFERQERRLKERRMLIEKQLAEEQELIDMEERALQRKKAAKTN